MRAVEHPAHSFQLRPPDSEDEWSQAGLLIAELQEWDAQQCQALGFSRDDVLSTFYPDGIADIRRHSLPPSGRFLLAVDASSLRSLSGLGAPSRGSAAAGEPKSDRLLGCAAFRRLTDTSCELYDVYVRPGARGRGVASLLLRRLLSDAKAAGYGAMLLETAVFMREAHAVYRSLDFQVCPPYRTIPPRFANATLWMERRLPG